MEQKAKTTALLKPLVDPQVTFGCRLSLFRYTSYTDEKIIIKSLSKKKWKQQHPNYNQSDSLHKLYRPEQAILFRLRTGHNTLNAHMYN